MSEPKVVRVENPANLPTLSLKTLREDYQWNLLKEKKNRDVGDLKQSILALGFKVPLFIWEEGKYVTDGTGRLVALEMLEYEGYAIPRIPYLPIEAANLKEAKRMTLAVSSKYGNVTEQSAGEFMLDMDEIDLSFINLPDLDLEEIDWKPEGAGKKEPEEKRGKVVKTIECPNCHHKFSSQDSAK